jgi:hypothetical protein
LMAFHWASVSSCRLSMGIPSLDAYRFLKPDRRCKDECPYHLAHAALRPAGQRKLSRHSDLRAKNARGRLKPWPICRDHNCSVSPFQRRCDESATDILVG